LLNDARGILDIALGENVGMAPDKFRRHFIEDFVNSEATLLGRDLGMHDGEENHVPELLPQVRVVIGPHRSGYFVCFLNQGRQERCVRLLAVPRTTARRAKLRHDLAKFRKTRRGSL